MGFGLSTTSRLGARERRPCRARNRDTDSSTIILGRKSTDEPLYWLLMAAAFLAFCISSRSISITADPLPLALFREHDLPAENLRCRRRRQVAVKAEESALQIDPRLPAIQQRMHRARTSSRTPARPRSVSGIRSAEIGRRQHFFEGEIFDAHDLHRARHVAQPGTRQFIRSGPRREHVRHGIAGLEKALSVLVQNECNRDRQDYPPERIRTADSRTTPR